MQERIFLNYIKYYTWYHLIIYVISFLILKVTFAPTVHCVEVESLKTVSPFMRDLRIQMLIESQQMITRHRESVEIYSYQVLKPSTIITNYTLHPWVPNLNLQLASSLRLPSLSQLAPSFSTVNEVIHDSMQYTRAYNLPNLLPLSTNLPNLLPLSTNVSNLLPLSPIVHLSSLTEDELMDQQLEILRRSYLPIECLTAPMTHDTMESTRAYNQSNIPESYPSFSHHDPSEISRTPSNSLVPELTALARAKFNRLYKAINDDQID